MGACDLRATLLVCGLAVLVRAAEPAAPPALLLVCTPTGASTVRLQVLALSVGDTFAADTAVEVTFWAATAAAAVELSPPGPRTVALPLRTAGWAAEQMELVEVGEFSLAPPCPEALEVRGGARGQTARSLGRLRRGENGAAVAFSRTFPGAPAVGLAAGSAADEARTGLVFAAVYEPLDERRFTVRMGCFNCGGRRAVDEDLFLHFELSPRGIDLAPTVALGLHPDARPTDSSAWHEGELTVVQFGPYTLPEEVPEFIYLRAGLYNRQGDGARAPVAGPDDTNRALLGRVVSRQGQTRFERAPLACQRLPAGWETAKAEGER
jgi:hypothetical protein